MMPGRDEIPPPPKIPTSLGMNDDGPKSGTMRRMGNRDDDRQSIPPMAKHAIGWGSGASGIGLAVYLLMQQLDGTSAAVKELSKQVEQLSSDVKAVRYDVRQASALQDRTNTQAQKERDASMDAILRLDGRVDALEKGGRRRR